MNLQFCLNGFTITSWFLTQINAHLRFIANQKVLGVTLDNKLNFATRLLNITKNTNKKFNALTRVQKYMTTDQKKLIFSSFIKSQFTHCPLR